MSRFSSKKAFTVIEILVSITIIAIMISLVFIATSKSRANARDSRRIGDINQIQAALERYATDVGSYPETLLPGESLTNPKTGKIYLQKIPSNPEPHLDGVCAFDLDYTYKRSGSNTYTIAYCLASSSGYAAPGWHQAYPGVVVGAYGCAPECAGKVCGYDNCIGSCGSCAAGTSCSADQTICQTTCSADNQCGLCQKCVGGFCANQTAGEDVKNECASASCASGLCSGSGSCAVYEDNKKHGCSGCQVCRSGAVCGAALTGAIGNFQAVGGNELIALSWNYALDFDYHKIFRRTTYAAASSLTCGSTVSDTAAQNSYQDQTAAPSLYFYRVCPYIAGCDQYISGIAVNCSRATGSGEPTTQASGLSTVSSGVCNGDNTVNVTFYWQPGNGQDSLLVGVSGSVLPDSPSDGTVYQVNDVYGSGSKVYSVGAECYATVDNLPQNSIYSFSVYEYNDQNYLTTLDTNWKTLTTRRCP